MSLTEKIMWSAPPDIPGVEIVSVQNNQRAWFTFHQTYTICNIDRFVDDSGKDCRGEAFHKYRGKIHRTCAQSIMLLEPGEYHRNTRQPPTVDFSVALFDTKLVAEIAMDKGMGPNPHFTIAVSSDPLAYRALTGFHASLVKACSRLQRQALMFESVNQILSNCCEKRPRPLARPSRSQLKRAYDLLHENLLENISLDCLARAAGLSRFHFLRSFGIEYRLPPHALQISLRVNRVRQLLRAGVPVAEMETGFADQSHLIRHFKRINGITPGQYARMVNP